MTMYTISEVKTTALHHAANIPTKNVDTYLNNAQTIYEWLTLGEEERIDIGGTERGDVTKARIENL